MKIETSCISYDVRASPFVSFLTPGLSFTVSQNAHTSHATRAFRPSASSVRHGRGAREKAQTLKSGIGQTGVCEKTLDPVWSDEQFDMLLPAPQAAAAAKRREAANRGRANDTA